MNLHALFEPRSIAVVGASTEVGSVGNDIVKNLIEQKFSGKVFPVNPKATELYGLPCFPNLSSVPEEVECAVIAVKAVIVPTVLREAVEKKVRSAIVISAGFGEIGDVELEEEIARIAREGDMALLGPNCLGVLNPTLSMNASFARTLPPRGGVAFLSQSGALGTAVLDMTKRFGVGISKFASLGNKALLDESALLEYFASDRKTKVIAVYAESLRNPNALKICARNMARAKRPKPIIVLKSGRTAEGASALRSHTGALAGSDASYEALFEEAGMLRAETAEELFLFARAFSLSPLPAGRRIAILTNAGGPGVLAADRASSLGLTLSPLPDATRAKLLEFLPAAASAKNPIDILGDAKSDRYGRALEAILSDETVDMALVVLTPQSMTDVEPIAEKIALAAKKYKKPIVAVFMGGKLVERGRKLLMKKKIPIADFPEDGVRMLSALASFAESRNRKDTERAYSYQALAPSDRNDRDRAQGILESARASGRTTLSPLETLDLFRAYGFPLPAYGRVTTPEEALHIAQTFAGPVAIKVLSDDITHKTDAGGVVLGVPKEHAGEAFGEMMKRVGERAPEARLDGALLMEMAPRGGVELLLGSVADPSLGQTILVGSGGIYSEILRDTAAALVPVSKTRAETILSKLRVFPILRGARGGAPFNHAAVVECVGRLSELLADFPQIRELDINPLLVYPEGSTPSLLVVDGRIVLS